MITFHPILNGTIRIKDINQVAERLGYDLFIPYKFVQDIISAFVYYKLTGDPCNCISVATPYTDGFRELLKMIDFESIKTNNPIEFAIRVLQIVKSKTHLRQLEFAATSGLMFTTSDEDDVYNNYKFCLHTLTQSQLEVLDIQAGSLNTIKLSKDILEILRLYEGISILEQPLETRYEVVKKQITSYNDYYKTRKYKLSLPTYPIDLAMKKLQITKVHDEEVKTSETILAIDYSLSMSQNKLSEPFIRSVLLHYIGLMDKNKGLTITILTILGGIHTTRSIDNVEDLKSIFKRLPVFILPVKKLDSVFKDLERLYAGKSVVFLTDGKLNLKTSMKLKYKLFTISLTENKMLKQLSQLSGGQFIVVHE